MRTLFNTVYSRATYSPPNDAGFDIVSDLADGTDTINVHASDVPLNGTDPDASSAAPKPVQPKKVEDKPADKAPSLRDQISSALKGEDNTPPAASKDGGTPRNPDGTFAPKAAETPPVGGTPPDAGGTPAPNAVAAPPGIDPQVFSSLPAETQAQLARTMEDVQAQQQRYATLEPIEQIIAPRREAWALNGVSPQQALNQLFALSDFAGRDTAGFIKYVAKANNIDLEDLVLGMEPEVPADPAIAAVQKELAELRTAEENRVREQARIAHERTVNDVIAFASEKGQDGQPLRPHFEAVGNVVPSYISMVKAENPTWEPNRILQEAYDRACWSIPAVREKMQAATQAAAEATRLREAADRADKARTASSSVRSGVPANPPPAPNHPGNSVRDTIRAAIAAAS
jgi:hypothetical protein